MTETEYELEQIAIMNEIKEKAKIKDIYKQVTWNWEKDLLNYRITIDWLRDMEHENRCRNDLPYDKRARYLQDLLLQKIEFGLQSIDDCIEILFTDSFSDLIPKNFEDYEHEDCVKFINNSVKISNQRLKIFLVVVFTCSC